MVAIVPNEPAGGVRSRTVTIRLDTTVVAVTFRREAIDLPEVAL
jgi:hypothetical protein